MDNSGYRKWDVRSEGVPTGQWGRCERSLLVALALVIITVLWALVLSILLSKASKERLVLLDRQGMLRTNASNQAVALGNLQKAVGDCRTCCSETQAQLKTARAALEEAQKKLMEQGGTLSELQERVTKEMALAGRDRENIRSELLRALEAAKFGNSSCEPCPAPWLPFQGSCYLFSKQRAKWEEAQKSCGNSGAHLVLVGNLEEQTFLSQHTGGRGYWLGLRAVRRAGKVQGYQWVDGVQMTFSHWNTGEPNDSRGREDCVMMLHTGLWNDAPCENEKDNWICEKRHRC
ncbi:C-type lectin domain family 4 member G-like [Rhynchocyon petersi]